MIFFCIEICRPKIKEKECDQVVNWWTCDSNAVTFAVAYFYSENTVTTGWSAVVWWKFDDPDADRIKNKT